MLKLTRKNLYDRQVESPQCSPGDQALALMPLQVSLFQAQFAGPYTVERQVSGQDYLIATLLKPYYAHDTTGVTEKVNAGSTLMVESRL